MAESEDFDLKKAREALEGGRDQGKSSAGSDDDFDRKKAQQALEKTDAGDKQASGEDDFDQKKARDALAAKDELARLTDPVSSLIPKENQYHDVGSVTDALDYSGNIGKSAAVGLLEGGPLEAAKQGWQGATKERRTDASQLLDKLDSWTEKKGLPRVFQRAATGKETHLLGNILTHGIGEKYPWDDLEEYGKLGVDKSKELALDIATDPQQLALMLAAPEGELALAGVRAGMGAVAGVGAAPSDWSPEAKVAAGTAGAATGLFGPTIAKEALQGVKLVSRDALNGTKTWMKGPLFRNYGEQQEVSQEARAVMDKFKAEAEMDLAQRLKGVPEKNVLAAKDAMADTMTYGNKLVEDEEHAWLAQNPGKDRTDMPPGWRQETRDDVAARIDQQGIKHVVLQGADPETVKAYEALEDHNDWLTEKVNTAKGSTDGLWYLDKDGKAQGFGDMPYHVENLWDKGQIQKAYEAAGLKMPPQTQGGLSGPALAGRSADRPMTWHPPKAPDGSPSVAGMNGIPAHAQGPFIGFGPSYSLYLDGLAKNVLTKRQREAQSFMAAYHAAPTQGNLQKGLSALGTGWNELTSIFKNNALFSGVNFIRNHAMEDIKKSYMTNGLMGLVDVAKMPWHVAQSYKDMKAIQSGSFLHVFDNPRTAKAFIYGAADPHKLFWAQEAGASEAYARLKGGDRAVQQLLDAKAPRTIPQQVWGATRKVLETLNNPLTLASNVKGYGIQPFGQAMEVAFRTAHFNRTADMLLNSPKALVKFGAPGTQAVRGILGNEQALQAAGVNLDALYKTAAKATNDTFFNYKNATEGEKLLKQKLMPFISFYAKNFKLYAASTFDPKRMARIHQMNYATRVVHPLPMSKEEAAGLPEYVRQNNPQIYARDPDGGIGVHFEPKDTYNEAGKWLTEPGRELTNNLHPAIKYGLERLLDKDLFTRQELLPSQTYNNELSVHGHGYWDNARKKFIDDQLPPKYAKEAEDVLGLYGMGWSDYGYPVATDDKAKNRLDLTSNLAPATGLDQLFKILGKTNIPGLDQKVFGDRPGEAREDLGDAIMNMIGPYETMHLTPKQLERNATGGGDWMEKRRREKQNEYLKEQLEKRKADFNGK